MILQVASGSEEIRVNLRFGSKIKCIAYGLSGITMFNTVRGTQDISKMITLLNSKEASLSSCVKGRSIIDIMIEVNENIGYDNKSKNLYQSLVFSLMWMLEEDMRIKEGGLLGKLWLYTRDYLYKKFYDSEWKNGSEVYEELIKNGIVKESIMEILFTAFREMFGVEFKPGKIKVREDNKNIEIPIKELIIEPHVLTRLRNFECKTDNTIKFFNDQGHFNSTDVKEAVLTPSEVQFISTLNLVKLILDLFVSGKLDVILESDTLRKNLKLLELKVWNVTENNFKKLSEFPLKELYITYGISKYEVIEYQCIYDKCELQRNVKALHLSRFEIRNEKSIEILANSYSLTEFTFDCRDFLTAYTLFYYNRLSYDNRFVKTLKEITILLGDFIPFGGLYHDIRSELRKNEIFHPLDLILTNKKLRVGLKKLGVCITKTSGGDGYGSVKNISLLSEFKKLNEITLWDLNHSLDEIFVQDSNISKTLKFLALHFDGSYTLTLNDLEAITRLKVLKKLIIKCDLMEGINLEEKEQEDVLNRLKNLVDFQFYYTNNTGKNRASFQRLKDFPAKTLFYGVKVQHTNISSILNHGGEETVLSNYLIRLILTNIFLDKDDFIAISKCKSLQKLCLCNCKVTGDISKIDSSEFNINLDELCSMYLEFSDIESIITNLFKGKGKVKKLIMIGDSNLTIQNIETIISLLDDGVIIEIVPKGNIAKSFQEILYNPKGIYTFVSSYYSFHGITRFSIGAFRAFLPQLLK